MHEIIFKCPVTKEDLNIISIAENQKLALYIKSKLNSSKHILSKEFDKIDIGLINHSKTLFYPIFNNIYFLLSETAIQLKNIDLKISDLDNDSKLVKGYYNNYGWVKSDKTDYQEVSNYEDVRCVSKNYLSKCRQRVNDHLNEKGKYLLDVACGPLENVDYQSHSNNFEFRICMDISLQALLEAQNNFGTKKGLFVLGNITNLPIKNNIVDNAISLHTIYHVPKNQQETAIRELYRVTKPNSNCIIAYNWGWNAWLMNITMFPMLGYRAIKRVFKLRSKNKSIKQQLYFYSHSQKWFKNLHFKQVEITCWKSLHTNFIRFYIHRWFFGKRILNIIGKLEDRFPKFFGMYGSHPMLIIKKR